MWARPRTIVNFRADTTSSLPSSPPRAATAEDGNSQYHTPKSPASPAFSTSSTYEEGGSSPVLPPLPAPTISGRALTFLKTPPRTSEGTQYYTASWGSPYEEPPVSERPHLRTFSSEPSEDSPLRHLEFRTPFLRPAPTFTRSQTEPDFISQDGSISAAVLANRARRPAQGLTEDWIRQHTGGESAENHAWLSDDPGESEYSSLSGSNSGEGQDWFGQETSPRTPTLKRFLETREKLRDVLAIPFRRNSAETLKQEDFSDVITPTMSAANEFVVVPSQMGNENSRPGADKGAPMVPPKDTLDWTLDWRASASLGLGSSSATLPTPRLKKKISWKGRNILILLPWDDERGQPGKSPKPMTKEQVEARMIDWEQKGYNTTAFNLGEGTSDAGLGQSRGIWPGVEDVEHERRQRSFKVNIPDRREWDAYVRELSEAKLRALGVSFGDDDPPPAPVAPAINRRASIITTYPTLPFSPPIPTGSAGSSHMSQHANPFSPPLMGGNGLSTSQSSNPGSIASPASMHGHMQGKYNPRQSISFSGDHSFGSPFQYPQQSPGVWSPQQSMYQQGHRGVSPSLANLGALASPSSPFNPDGYFQQGDMVAQMNARQHLLQNQLHQQQQLQMSARASPRLPEVSEVDEDLMSKSPSKTPEARQVRHNPSASLQKEIDDAEYHLEEQFQRQLEHDDYSPHSDNGGDDKDLVPEPTHIRSVSSKGSGLAASRFANSDSEEGPVLHHPQPHSRGHSLSQRPFQDNEDSSVETKPELLKSLEALKELSDLETNPSNLGTPAQDHSRAISMSSNPWIDSEANLTDNSSAPKSRRPGHGAKPSISTLNVSAKEFKFEPTNAFKPGNFSFSGANFQGPVAPYSSFNPNMSSTSSHFSNHSISSGQINVAAPVFTPGHSEFSFSASGPTFRPDAPTFAPSYSSKFANSIGSAASGNEGPRSSLFGNIDLSAIGISKPDKKNKAIPIIRPDSDHSRDDEDVEDKDGRITQGAGRIKRARGDHGDGDSVPLFAPSMPLGETTREQSPPKENHLLSSTTADKENSAPDSDGSAGTLEATRTSPEATMGKDYAPFEFPQQKEAEDFNAARSFTSRRYNSGLPGYGFYAPSEDEKASLVEGEEGEEEEGHSEPEQLPEPAKKAHKKNSLSGAAKPFEFRPGAFNFTFGEPAESPPSPVVPVSLTELPGLAASRYANNSSPPPVAQSPDIELQPDELPAFQASLPGPQSPPIYDEDDRSDFQDHEPTFEEIDEVMRQLNEVEHDSNPTLRTNPHGDEDISRWHQPSPSRHIQMPNMDLSNNSPIRLNPQHLMRSDAPSPSPGRFQALPGQQAVFSRVHDDPFNAESPTLRTMSPIHRLNTADSLPPSDWDDVLSDGEAAKLQPRSHFFDGHVNDLVDGLLEQRLDPVERALQSIQLAIEQMAARGPSSRLERRSMSGVLSDADDEDDDEVVPRRSMSPRRDKKMDKIRAIVTEALVTHRSRPQTATSVSGFSLPDSHNLLAKMEEMMEQFGQSMRLDLRGDDLRNIVEEAVQARIPGAVMPDQSTLAKEAEAHSRIADLEERLRRADAATEHEVLSRRAVEDRLAENQRLLRISAEEEMRLREAMDERDLKIREIIYTSDSKVRSAEDDHSKIATHNIILEASYKNSQKDQKEIANRLAITESHLREAQQQVQRLQIDNALALEAATRHSDDAEQANETNRDLRRTIDSLRLQMEESNRVREGMRGMLTGLQEDMALAARDITQENTQRAKREAELVARQEVLSTMIQAETRTRERLESEIVRLEASQREGVLAVSECTRLELLVTELRQECHIAQKDAMRYQREFEEARESGLGEVQRTRNYMQAEIESANNQVNVVRDDLEVQLTRLRNELDQVRLDADTAREQHEMLLESAEDSKQTIADELRRKHANEMEDFQTKYERQLNITIEDAQRSEQHLLERLSLSSSKTEHLQDRVSHLEEKLEIAKSAANAAVAAAKDARSSSASLQPAPYQAPTQQKLPSSKLMDLPERISPQALRESIMVLQEQLQAREQSIEKLEATLATVDPESATKIQKRDDEISWLRELLDVRKSDLKDIVSTLSSNEYDPEQAKEAAIRLSANLQMEEQERERAMNGGSAINLPNIAASLRDAATPRVAQAVGPLAAAWGNWRKGRGDSSFTEAVGAAPARTGGPPGSYLGGLLTPPASSVRTTPGGSSQQPTAFGRTGQRFTPAQLANRPRNMTSRAREKQPMRSSPQKAPQAPSTPPMMRKASYDSDARAEDFSDAGFYDDDESAIDESVYGGKLR